MKKIINKTIFNSGLGLLALALVGCQRDVSELQPATYSANPDVFIDDFSSGLNYASFGNAYPQAFQVDSQVKYAGTKSMRFEVPDYGTPNGAYAGGSFFTSVGRDLSDYNCLTFWIKATQSATIDVIGFGNDFGANKYQTSINGLPVNTNWKKVYIPIPDAAKLVAEKGMFFYSEGPEDNKGYTFWVDEVKFEKVSGISQASAKILNGEDRTITSFLGVKNQIDGIEYSVNLPDGLQQSVTTSINYFNFKSSNPSVATVDESGSVTTVGSGTSTITATLGSLNAKGSLTLNSNGTFVPASKPTVNASKVISVFSDAYTNIPVDYYNGYWAPYQTTQSSDFAVNNDHVLNYTNFNFVGIQFSSPTVNVSTMTHLHLDLFVPSALQTGASMKVEIMDFGANGVFGGGDDKSQEIAVPTALLQGQKWISVDLPLASLPSKAHLAQIILKGTNISSIYADNIYFYNDGSIMTPIPTASAPVPTASATSVLSVFSDTYTNVAGTDFNPIWGQTTQVSQLAISGNNTLKYTGLNYQGTQFASPLNASSYGYLHVDYYTANSSNLKFYLVSPGTPPVEMAYTLAVPSGVGANTNGWKSVDIPLSSFAPVDLKNIIQFKVDGNGDVFFDNLYFHN